MWFHGWKYHSWCSSIKRVEKMTGSSMEKTSGLFNINSWLLSLERALLSVIFGRCVSSIACFRFGTHCVPKCIFLICSTLWSELSWSYYRLLMRVQDELARTFYAEECAKSAWRVRQLEWQINTMYYQRILASQDKSLCMRANWCKPCWPFSAFPNLIFFVSLAFARISDTIKG